MDPDQASNDGPVRGLLARNGARLLVLLVTLWAGALWTTGFIVAPTLFEMLSDRALAGSIAGRLFHVLNWIGIVAGFYTVAFCLCERAGRGLRDSRVWLAGAMLAIALAMQFGVQPLMADLRALGIEDEAVRSRFATWHGVSSVAYVIQSLLAVILVLRVR